MIVLSWSSRAGAGALRRRREAGKYGSGGPEWNPDPQGSSSILTRLITRIVATAVALYHRVERRGPPLPDGPVLVVANHLNALVDPLVIFRTGGRPTRPLAKAPLFEHPFIGPALKGLGGLPVFRPSDDPDLVHRNEATFDAAIDALHRGEAVQIYPEGQSHSGPSLTPLKTGAARIALQAEERAGWTLGLRVVPVGLVYRRKHLFRGAAVAVMGEPFGVAERRTAWEEDSRTAVRDLTAEISRRLTAVTLNVPSTEDRILAEAAEALHARGRGEARPRERTPLGGRVERLRGFARGLVWLRTNDPDQYERLRRRVRRYRRLQGLLGSGAEAAVPERYEAFGVAAYALREGCLLLLLGPPALLAAAAWWVPYRLPPLVVRAVKPALDAVSTYKLSVALLAFPVTWLAWVAVGWWAGGSGWAAITAVALPLSGLAWIDWRERLGRVAEDLGVFLRSAPRRSTRERLAALRRELVESFERVAEAMPAEAEEGPGRRPAPRSSGSPGSVV